MRERQRRLVMTFDTTTAAMALEALCHARGLPGRLIPTPRRLSGQCGLAWSAPPETETALLQAMEGQGLRHRDCRILLL